RHTRWPRDWSSDVCSSDLLFKPREAYRVDWSGGFFGAGTDAHPVGKNPPNGAMIYYWLKEKSRPVTLDILDGAGRLIRSFTSKRSEERRVGEADARWVSAM